MRNIDIVQRSNKTFNFIRGTMTGHIYLILWGFLPLLKLEFCLGDTFGGKVYTFGGKVYKMKKCNKDCYMEEQKSLTNSQCALK